jgi:hypothetical protein
VWGCGGAQPTPPPPPVKITRPARAVWCPTKPIHAISLSRPNPRGENSFDTRTLLGQAEAAAAAQTRRHGCLWRVVRRDGRELTITSDSRPNRVDAAVDRGTVTATGVF